MVRNIVWCGGVLAALVVMQSTGDAAGVAAAALAGVDWTTPILAAIGLGLTWLLVARGPFI